MTVRFFAAVDPDLLTEALSPAHLPAATATAGPAPTALSNRVWVLPVSGLEPLARAVAQATAHLDPGPRDAGGFRGHLTLARARRPGALRALAAPRIENTWPVDHIVAMSSELRPTGAVHHELGRWPLPAG